MIIENNTNFYKTITDFEKYAKFLSKNFDVTIQFESVKAETDGKIIYLPRLENFTEKEISMLYGILLHEIGHILFSSFEEKYFLALKTELHAHLANSIEDARIENLLIKKFGGAQDIFNELYNNYLNDKDLMKKVFKFTGRKPSLFYSFSFYIHNYLVSFKIHEFKKFIGVRNFKAINTFITNHNINELLDSSPLKNSDDVLSLTNKLYDLFYSHFKVKDESNELNYSKEVDKKDNINNQLEKLKKDSLAQQQNIEQLKIEQKDLIEEKKDFMYDNQSKINQLQGDIYQLDIELSQENKQKDLLSKIIDAKKSFDSLPNKISNVNSSINQKQEQIDKLESQINRGKNKRGTDFSPEKMQSMKDVVQQKAEQLKSLNEKLESLLKTETDINNTLNDLEYESGLDTSQPIEFFESNKSALNDKIADISSEKNEALAELKKIETQIKNMDERISNIDNSIAQIMSNVMENAAKLMKELDKKSKKDSFDVDFIPEHNYEDSWKEAAEVQEKFDEKATKDTGKVVHNGEKHAGLFGSDIQDIVLFIDKKQNEVKEIDILSLFKDKIHQSKINDVISENTQTNFQEDQTVNGIYGTYRPHLPLTTEFDTIIKKNHNTHQYELNQLLKANHSFYQSLKQTFVKVFKFSKKEFWRGAQEEGELDARNLWKIPTNQGDDFYEVNNPKFINKVAVSILVDISGSQNKENTSYGEKLKSLVLGFSTALDAVHVKHEILGFHAPVCNEMRQANASDIYTRRSNSLETIIFKESSQKDKSGILNIIPEMSDNSDGESLRIAVKRLKKISAKNHLVFLISDGKPFLSDSDISVLDEDFRQALSFANREKVKVFGFGYFNQLGYFLNDNFCNATNEQHLLKFCEKKLNRIV